MFGLFLFIKFKDRILQFRTCEHLHIHITSQIIVLFLLHAVLINI